MKINHRIIAALASFALVLASCQKKDVSDPIVLLNGPTSDYFPYGFEYEDPGATAIDNEDGDLTELILVGGSIDAFTMETQELNYRASDAAGNTGWAYRQVIRYYSAQELEGAHQVSTGVIVGYDTGCRSEFANEIAINFISEEPGSDLIELSPCPTSTGALQMIAIRPVPPEKYMHVYATPGQYWDSGEEIVAGLLDYNRGLAGPGTKFLQLVFKDPSSQATRTCTITLNPPQ